MNIENLKNKRNDLIQKLRESNNFEEHENIKDEIDLIEEEMYDIRETTE